MASASGSDWAKLRVIEARCGWDADAVMATPEFDALKHLFTTDQVRDDCKLQKPTTVVSKSSPPAKGSPVTKLGPVWFFDGETWHRDRGCCGKPQQQALNVPSDGVTCTNCGAI